MRKIVNTGIQIRFTVNQAKSSMSMWKSNVNMDAIKPEVSTFEVFSAWVNCSRLLCMLGQV